jgi:hypothetical protein
MAGAAAGFAGLAMTLSTLAATRREKLGDWFS